MQCDICNQEIVDTFTRSDERKFRHMNCWTREHMKTTPHVIQKYFRISGILHACDPLDLNTYCQTDEYDSYILDIMKSTDEQQLKSILQHYSIYSDETYNQLKRFLF